MIKQNTINLLNLINQILDLRKLESKSLELKMVKGDVIPYLRYIISSYHSHAESNDLQLEFHSSKPTLIMDYDPDKLLRIVSNLLSNAIKYTPAGGHVYFQIDQKEEANQEWLEIQVKDTGVGIPANQLPYIFDRFYQVDDSTTRKAGGTGIGLALTKELVKLKNGQIEAISEVGKGSTFTVHLPITRNSVQIAASEITKYIQEEETIRLNNNITIAYDNFVNSFEGVEEGSYGKDGSERPLLLIVEDNPDVVQYLIACLETDYQLAIAHNVSL